MNYDRIGNLVTIEPRVLFLLWVAFSVVQFRETEWAFILNKILYFLIGPKGSGKTHIGTLINNNTNIKFLRVESIWLTVKPGEDGWKKVEQAIAQEFESNDEVMVESLGAGDEFKKYLASLQSSYNIKMIQVKASLETCLERVQNRVSSDHIPVSDDEVMEYNQIASQVAFDWDLVIENDPPAPDDKILEAVSSLQ